MKMKSPITVKIGSHGHKITEPAKDVIFTYPDVPGEWHVLENDNSYVLCRDTGKYLTFVEFCREGQSGLLFYKAREWRRRPRDDNNYTLTKHEKYHGTRMPLIFFQCIKNAIKGTKGNGD